MPCSISYLVTLVSPTRIGEARIGNFSLQHKGYPWVSRGLPFKYERFVEVFYKPKPTILPHQRKILLQNPLQCGPKGHFSITR